MDTDPRLRDLAAQIKTEREKWNRDPTEETGRRILALQDAEHSRYMELTRTDLERAKATTAETRAAVQEARQVVAEARRALGSGEGPVEAVITAEDTLRDAKRRLRFARTEEEVVRTHLSEAAVARWGPAAVGAVTGLPIRVSVSPSATPALHDALGGDGS